MTINDQNTDRVTGDENCYTTQQVSPYADNTHTHPFNGPLPGTTRVSQYHKGKNQAEFY